MNLEIDNFHNIIKIRRKQLDLTQAQIAALTGISQASISQIEKGLTLPTFHNLIAISSVLLLEIKVCPCLLIE